MNLNPGYFPKLDFIQALDHDCLEMLDKVFSEALDLIDKLDLD